MQERDGHPPGVPRRGDSGRPHPEAAVEFYGGLFGWGLADRMPPGAQGRYFGAPLRGGDVAWVAPHHRP